jgi:outer membrane protein assembly factor BamD (BamD/ComL family)
MFALAQGTIALAEKQKRVHGNTGDFGTRDQLLKQARNLCFEYLLRYPADGDADEVCYTLINIAIEGKQWDEALTLLTRAVKAYADSPWLDDFLFLNGYALFLKKDFDAARKVLDRIVKESFVLENGRRGKSPNRFLSIFLQGQCEHARGNIVQAVSLYRQVVRHFSEAKEALAFFEEKKLKLPDVTMLKPGAEAMVELSTRNLDHIDLLVYKVDLMRLYLMRRSLADMGEVRLLGIPPTQSFGVNLKASTPFRDYKQRVPLKLGKDGACLILAQSGGLKSSGLVLRSDLKIDTQEYPSQNRLRLNVKKKGLALPGARVKIVRSGSKKVLSGTTDLRGVFVGDGLRGRVTALVESGGQYAFYRSPLSYGRIRRKSQGGYHPKGQAEDLLRNNFQELRKLQKKGGQSLDRLFKNQQRGVELKRTK